MIRPPTSLIDILVPPENHWLRDLSKRKANLPAGVRVIRFGEEEDLGPEAQEDIAAPRLSGSAEAPSPQHRAAR